MNRIKSFALATFSMIIAIAALGFFAIVGFALIGGLVAMGAMVALVAGISNLFVKRDTTVDASATA